MNEIFTRVGLGAVCIGTAPLKDRMEKVEAVLGDPDGLHAFALVPVGYPAETKAQEDRFLKPVLYFDLCHNYSMVYYYCQQKSHSIPTRTSRILWHEIFI